MKNIIENGINYNELGNFFGEIKNKNIQEYSEEEFIKKLDNCIQKLRFRIVNIKGNSIEEKELKQEMSEVLEIYSNLKNNKELLAELIIQNEKRNILNKDYDNDGLSNKEEILKGLDPFSIDSDRDGILDKQDVFKNQNDKGRDEYER